MSHKKKKPLFTAATQQAIEAQKQKFLEQGRRPEQHIPRSGNLGARLTRKGETMTELTKRTVTPEDWQKFRDLEQGYKKSFDLFDLIANHGETQGIIKSREILFPMYDAVSTIYLELDPNHPDYQNFMDQSKQVMDTIKQFKIKTEAGTMSIRPLPEPAPPTWWSKYGKWLNLVIAIAIATIVSSTITFYWYQSYINKHYVYSDVKFIP